MVAIWSSVSSKSKMSMSSAIRSGALAVQLASASGARVIATAKSDTEADFVARLTDTETLLADYTQDLAPQVRHFAPHGVDGALHLAGDLAELTALVRDGGAIASLLAAPESPAGRELRTAMVLANPTAETLSALAAQVAKGALSVPVTAVHELEHSAEAFAAFGAGALGKIAINVA